MKKIALLSMFLGFATLAVSQEVKQKIGHLNTGNVMEILPEIKTADEKLKTLQDSLNTKENELIAIFEKEYTEFVTMANAGELTKIAIQKKQAEFQEKEQEILDLRKEVQLEVLKKRQEIMNPILERLQKAVDDVAKEHGFSYIMDIGSGALLYARESEDIEPLVKKKLGVE